MEDLGIGDDDPSADALCVALYGLVAGPAVDPSILDDPFVPDDIASTVQRYAESSDSQAPRAGLYNFVSRWIQDTEQVSRDEVEYLSYDDGTLQHVDLSNLDPTWLQPLLVHEARHNAPPWHVDCGDAEELCDEGWDSASGFGAAAAHVMTPQVVGFESARESLALQRARQARRILSTPTWDWTPPGSEVVVAGPWTWTDQDTILGVYPEDGDVGSACVASVEVQEDGGVPWFTQQMRASGTVPDPEYLAMELPDGRSGTTGTWGEPWEATCGHVVDIVDPAGPWEVSLRYPEPQPPADAQEGEAACAAAYGSGEAHFHVIWEVWGPFEWSG